MKASFDSVAAEVLQLLDGSGWVTTEALFNRSSFDAKSDLNALLRQMERAGKVKRRFGPVGCEAAVPGVTEDPSPRAHAKPPEPPPGAGPMPPRLTAPAPLVPAPSNLRGIRGATGTASAEAVKIAAVVSVPSAAPVAEAKTKTDAPKPPRARADLLDLGKRQRTKMLELLISGPMRAQDLAQACEISMTTTNYHLNRLRAEALVINTGQRRGSRWQLKAMAAAAARDSKPQSAAPAAVRGLSIERLDLKVDVLDRLSVLLEPDIARVLREIREDLRTAAAGVAG